VKQLCAICIVLLAGCSSPKYFSSDYRSFQNKTVLEIGLKNGESIETNDGHYVERCGDTTVIRAIAGTDLRGNSFNFALDQIAFVECSNPANNGVNMSIAFFGGVITGLLIVFVFIAAQYTGRL
jgi:hypothetical protein